MSKFAANVNASVLGRSAEHSPAETVNIFDFGTKPIAGVFVEYDGLNSVKTVDSILTNDVSVAGISAVNHGNILDAGIDVTQKGRFVPVLASTTQTFTVGGDVFINDAGLALATGTTNLLLGAKVAALGSVGGSLETGGIIARDASGSIPADYVYVHIDLT